MPKRKEIPPDEVLQDESILSEEQPTKWGGARPRRPKLIIPITDEGTIDMERVRKNPEVLEKARIALGMPAGSMDASSPVEVQIPEEMLPLIPHLYDGLAYVIKFGLKVAKFPKAFTEDQRSEFRDCLRYSDKFKREATEPTARLLQKVAGNSAITQWLMKNSDVAILLKLLGEGTYEMITNGAQEFAQKHLMKQQEQTDKPNGGFPASEFRSVPDAGHEGAMEQ